MEVKFNRNYQLLYYYPNPSFPMDETKSLILPITLPFSIEFDVTRNDFASWNVGTIRIFNLSQVSREAIRKDQFNINIGQRKVILMAGYGNQLNIVLNQLVTRAYSVREGVDFITEIQCTDGAVGYLDASYNRTWPAKTFNKQIIEDMVANLAKGKIGGIGIGAIGSAANGQINKATPYSGPTMKLLQELTGDAIFIDNSVAHVLTDNECISGNTFVVNSQTGLLGTPVREQAYVNFTMLFEPKIQVGNLVTIQSSTGDAGINNTIYKVKSLHHHAMISPTVCKDAITEIGCYKGTFLPVTPSTTNA